MQKNKVIIKFLFIIMIFVIMVSVFPNDIFAAWTDDAQSFLRASGGEDVGIDQTKLNDASSDIYNTLTSIGMVISVIVGLVLGIKFMLSNTEEKAKVKEALVPYIVGCVVIFGAFGIWKLIIKTFFGL